jgi:hypothetical protein
MDGPVPASSVNEFLAHYGVKGMRWGVSKSSSSGGSGSRSSSSEDHKIAVAAEKKINRSGTQSLSNKELQGLIQRKNLEKQYRDMQIHEKSSMERGDETIKKILKYGKTYNDVQAFLKTPAGQKVKTGFKIAGMAAKVGAAYATGGTSAAATAGAGIAVRRMSNHYTNVG